MMELGTARATVANFAHFNKTVKGQFETAYIETAYIETATRMKFETKLAVVSVCFVPVKNNPELMYVGASNWKYEDEPHGVYPIEKAREFYKKLRAVGFQRDVD